MGAIVGCDSPMLEKMRFQLVNSLLAHGVGLVIHLEKLTYEVNRNIFHIYIPYLFI